MVTGLRISALTCYQRPTSAPPAHVRIWSSYKGDFGNDRSVQTTFQRARYRKIGTDIGLNRYEEREWYLLGEERRVEVRARSTPFPIRVPQLWRVVFDLACFVVPTWYLPGTYALILRCGWGIVFQVVAQPFLTEIPMQPVYIAARQTLSLAIHSDFPFVRAPAASMQSRHLRCSPRLGAASERCHVDRSGWFTDEICVA